MRYGDKEIVRIDKELIYEDDNFVLFKISEYIKAGSESTYIPVGNVRYLRIDEDVVFAEYYAKQDKLKLKRCNPKYNRGFKFHIYNISPIEIPLNTVAIYTPLYVCEYECEIDSVNIFETEITYGVNITCSNSKMGMCYMKENTIDNIVKQYNCSD